MERPAHTALFQSIWNHPAEENGQNVNLGSCGGGSSFCGLPSPSPLLVEAIICAPANYRVVHLDIFDYIHFVKFDFRLTLQMSALILRRVNVEKK